MIEWEWAYTMHVNPSTCTSEGTARMEEISHTCTEDPQENKYLVINTNPRKYHGEIPEIKI